MKGNGEECRDRGTDACSTAVCAEHRAVFAKRLFVSAPERHSILKKADRLGAAFHTKYCVVATKQSVDVSYQDHIRGGSAVRDDELIIA